MLDAKAVAEVLGSSVRLVNGSAKRLKVGHWTRCRTGSKRLYHSDDIDAIKADLQKRENNRPVG